MIKYVIIFFIFFSCASCLTQKENKINSSKIPYISCSEYYLENRITDCVLAKEFMDYHIVPDSSGLFIQTDSKYYAIINTNIPGENNELKDNNLIKFYINPKCLESMSSLELLSIFLSKKELNKFAEILKDKKNRIGVDILIDNLGGFNVALVNTDIVEFNMMKSG